MTDGLAALIQQAIRAGFCLPAGRADEEGDQPSTSMDTTASVGVSHTEPKYKIENNEIDVSGHRDVPDTHFDRHNCKHPKQANERKKSQHQALKTEGGHQEMIVEHLGRGAAGQPTHPATCRVCGKADWLVNVRDDRDRTFHVSCWRTEAALNFDGD